MRRESIAAFRGHREELADREAAELAVLETYLPRQMSEEEIRELARQAIADTGAAGPRDQGKVMQRVMPAVRGRADGKVVAEVVAGMLREQG